MGRSEYRRSAIVRLSTNPKGALFTWRAGRRAWKRREKQLPASGASEFLQGVERVHRVVRVLAISGTCSGSRGARASNVGLPRATPR